MPTRAFSKFVRPETARKGIISDRDLDIIEAVLRYRFSPTSELVRLVGGNEDVTQRRLRKLWESGILNRFAFPFPRPHSEFIYYIDRPQTLNLLSEHGRLREIHHQMEDEVRMNRDADYAGAALNGQHMKLGFLQHSLMISRMHYMIEMACRESEEMGFAWRQGAELRGHKVAVPEVQSRRVAGTNDYIWEERDASIRLPVEPDALFSLRLPDRPQPVHFCYEADRGTMPLADMLKKLRAYYYFIKRQQFHKEAFGVHPIRAVLIETTDEERGRKLMELAEHPAVMGQAKRSALFWFTISPLFAVPTDGVSAYLEQPAMILDRLWALPDETMRALGDAENR